MIYTQRYNIRHNRSGHLFQGRFKSFLVENDGYMMQLSCYIHRNPLRAGISKRLTDYKWSSYLSFAYGKKAKKWLKINLILSQFSGKKKEKYKAYRKKVQGYSNEEKRIWEDFKHGLFFGTQEFIDETREKYLPEKLHNEKPQQKDVKRSKNIEEQLVKAANAIGIDLEKIKRSKRLTGEDKIRRDLLMNMLWETGLYKNEDIGNFFGVTYSSVSKSVNEIRSLIIKDKKVKKMFEMCNSQFKM